MTCVPGAPTASPGDSLGNGDHFLAAHTITSTNFTDNRQYIYADMTRRLAEERLNLDSAHRWTNTFTFDSGQAKGPGVITKVAGSAGVSPVWSASVDALSRVTSETNTTVHRPAWGTNNGLATVSVFVDGKPMPVSITDTQGLKWRATLELTPGSHQLVAAALHPSMLFTAYATNTLTASPTNFDTLTTSYDANGNMTSRILTSPGLSRTQTLVWDAQNRLVKLIDRDSAGSGRNWSAVYDGLTRLLRIIDIPVVSGVTNTGEAQIAGHYYDPQFEFFEAGVNENGAITWKVMGPDFDGRYGGQNGTGGFEAIVTGPELFCPIIGDINGNLLVVNDRTHGGVVWYPSRVSANGAVPVLKPVPVGQGGNDLGAKYAWRNRAMTSIGFVWMGDTTWYDMDGQRFLGMDPRGRNGNRDDGYGPCRFSMLVDWDADGRLGKATVNGARDMYYSAGDAMANIPLGLGVAGSWLSGVGLQIMGENAEPMYQQADSLRAQMSPFARGGSYDPNSPSANLATFASMVFVPEFEAGKLAPTTEGLGAAEGAAKHVTYLYQKVGAEGEHRGTWHSRGRG